MWGPGVFGVLWGLQPPLFGPIWGPPTPYLDPIALEGECIARARAYGRSAGEYLVFGHFSK